MYYSSHHHQELFLLKRTGQSDIDSLIYLMTSDFLRKYFYLVFDEERQELLDFPINKLSSTEKNMIQLAKHLYNSSNKCPKISDLITPADEINREVISSAIYYYANAYKLKEADLL